MTFTHLIGCLRSLMRTRTELAAENLAPRHQLAILEQYEADNAPASKVA